MSETVILEEHGLLEGLMSLPIPLPTQAKLDWVDKLLQAGLSRIQVAAFENQGLVAQIEEAELLFSKLPKSKEVVLMATARDPQGIESAQKASVNHLSMSLSASETYGQLFSKQKLDGAKMQFRENMALAKSAKMKVRAGLLCAFGCRYEGEIDPVLVLDLIQFQIDAGADELLIADSTGMANPRDLQILMEKVLKLAGQIPVALQLYNTENKGLANLYAGLEVGVRQFDTSFGGFGGSPFVKRGLGMVATEDAVHLLHQMGYHTGIDPKKVSVVSKEAQGWLGFELPGVMYRLLNNPEIKNV